MKIFKCMLLILIALSFYCQNSIAKSDMPFPVSNPEEQNINASLLSKLHSQINNNHYGEVHSVLIVRNGHLIFERYYNDYTRDRLHRLNSVTKTVTSALVGIAIDQGKIDGVNEYMLDFFPEYSNMLQNNSQKEIITLEHILTMTAGFTDEDSIKDSNDYIKYMLDRPVLNKPGKVWSYSNGSSYLLSGIIKNRTGLSAEDYAKKYLFAPLGIENWSWTKGPNDLTATAGGLQLRPLDMALLGQLYLQNGVWKNSQIVSKDWIDKSVRVHVKFAKEDRSYGYHLWHFLPTSSVAQTLKKNDIFFASGAREQKVYVIPHLECVIVMTSENANTKDILLEILFAIKDRMALKNLTDDGTRFAHEEKEINDQ